MREGRTHAHIQENQGEETFTTLKPPYNNLEPAPQPGIVQNNSGHQAPLIESINLNHVEAANQHGCFVLLLLPMLLSCHAEGATQ